MNKPVKGLLGKLRRAEPAGEPEPELGAERIAALRIRAAVAEDPCLAEDQTGEDGLKPVVLARSARGADGQWVHAASWFGGLPKLGAIAWPVGADGLPLPFAAQVSLAEIAAASPCNPLPDNGSLAFFLGDGAVIHVPEGVSQFTPLPQQDMAVSLYWPVEAVPLTLPAESEEPATAGDAIGAALAALLPRRDAPFTPAEVDWNGPVPVWWHGVDYLIDELRLALTGATASGQRDSLSALIGALAGFAADRNPWDRLNPEERDVFVEALDNAWQQFPTLLEHPPVPRHVDDLAAVSIRAMMTGEGRAFAALPDSARERINRDYRLPPHGVAQMFGPPMETEGAPRREGDAVLLLQLPSDDMMDWDFGDGVYQFWIDPEALAARNWQTVRLTF